jgi:flagellar protein FliS
MTAAPPNAYLRTKVMTASPAELRLMLLEGAIKFADRAKDALLKKDFEGLYNGVTRCQDILMELINSLQPQHAPELCANLSALYTFLYTRLIAASTTREVGPIDEVLGLLHHERETWSMLLEKLAQEGQQAAGLAAAIQAPGSSKEALSPRICLQG